MAHQRKSSLTAWINRYTMAILFLFHVNTSQSRQHSLGNQPKERLNVLFIVSDDMRPELGSYKGKFSPSPIRPTMYTPNLDDLARKGFLALRAHVQYGMCGPSRTSFLTSRRPDTTHVYDNLHYFRKAGGDFTTLPQYFKENGYVSVGMGKIFHPGPESSGNDDPPSWSEPYWHAPNEKYWWLNKTKSWEAVGEDILASKPLPDDQITNKAIETLRRLAEEGKSEKKQFFMAVGFHKPHLPFVFPEKYLKLYPEENIHVPDNMHAPDKMPPIAWSDYYELRQYKDIARLHPTGAINSTLPQKVIMDLRRAYYSALSYTDALIGQLVEEVERLGLRDNTIISFIGDHGWQLGEHGEWCKHTNFELSTHAPLILSVPGTKPGIQSQEIIEMVDLYPTLVQLAGLPFIPRCPRNSTHVQLCTEGASFAGLLNDQGSPSPKYNPYKMFSHYKQKALIGDETVGNSVLQSKSHSFKNLLRSIIRDRNGGDTRRKRAFSQFLRSSRGKPVMGYSLRTDRYRYTEWVGFTPKPYYQPVWEDEHGAELYDHFTDPEENRNVASNEEYKNIRQDLRKELHGGWFNTM